MNSSLTHHLLLKLYFPAAFIVAVALLIFNVGAPPAVAQYPTVTRTVYVTITRSVYITLDRTLIVTMVTGIPTTLTSIATSAVTSVLTLTSVVNSLVTQTVSVTAPIQIGQFSLDLTDAGGLRFLAYSGCVAAAGFISGVLFSRLIFRRRLGSRLIQQQVPTP